MNRRSLTSLALAALVTLCGAASSFAVDKHANIEGTFKFVSRVETDSTIKTAPEVIGLQTFTKTYRNFSVMWKNPAGKIFSYTVISKYTLTDSTYTETKLYSVMNDEISGSGLKYDTEKKTETTKVTFENGKVSFKLPFDPVTMTFDGDKGTAVAAEMGFTDQWYRIR
jgi:hypothetical protein